MKRTARIALPAAIAAMTMVAGCGGEGSQGQGTAGQSQPGSTQPAATSKAAEKTDAISDVKITKCDPNAWTQSVTIEVTNSSATPAKYVVGIDIKGAEGQPASEARFVKNRIEPGKTLTETIPGDTQIKGAITCTVGEAKRLPPQ